MDVDDQSGRPPDEPLTVPALAPEAEASAQSLEPFSPPPRVIALGPVEGADSDEPETKEPIRHQVLHLASGGAEDPDSDDSEAEAEADEVVVEEHRLHSRVAPALIALDRIDEDGVFRLRPEGDIALLATDLARLGQLFPIDLRLRPPDRFQVICGFRRVAGLRFLQRDRVLARLHTGLSDEDALLMALAAAIHQNPVEREELGHLRSRLEKEGRLSPAARDMLQKALVTDDPLAPENYEDPSSEPARKEEEEEVDANELAADVARRLGAINQDLSALADVFSSLDPERRDELLTQLRYSSDLVTFLEALR
jgi:ParB-like chromosome segregation protein Spo0J